MQALQKPDADHWPSTHLQNKWRPRQKSCLLCTSLTINLFKKTEKLLPFQNEKLSVSTSLFFLRGEDTQPQENGKGSSAISKQKTSSKRKRKSVCIDSVWSQKRKTICNYWQIGMDSWGVRRTRRKPGGGGEQRVSSQVRPSVFGGFVCSSGV